MIRAWTLCAATLAVVASIAPATAAGRPAHPCAATPPPPSATISLTASTDHVGVISLRFFGAQGRPVVYYECVGRRAQRLGTRSVADGTITSFPSATVWRCGRPCKAGGWEPVATAQVARLRPSATVVSIGANKGYPLRAPDGTQVACCDEAWVVAFARRLRSISLTYRRQGRGRVVWLTIPAPRDLRRVPIIAAANVAIVRAAGALQRVSVVRIDELLSPGGHRDVVRYRERDVRVREPDGIHLNVAGTRIAAHLAAQAPANREP